MDHTFADIIGYVADLVLAGGAIKVTSMHLRAYRKETLAAKATDPTVKQKHLGDADTLRKNASLRDPDALRFILIATCLKLAATLLKLVATVSPEGAQAPPSAEASQTAPVAPSAYASTGMAD